VKWQSLPEITIIIYLICYNFSHRFTHYLPTAIYTLYKSPIWTAIFVNVLLCQLNNPYMLSISISLSRIDLLPIFKSLVWLSLVSMISQFIYNTTKMNYTSFSVHKMTSLYWNHKPIQIMNLIEQLEFDYRTIGIRLIFTCLNRSITSG